MARASKEFTLDSPPTGQAQKAQPPKYANLEAIRFVAAVWVVLYHVCRQGGNGPVERIFLSRADVPVIVFFVLSGFVIGVRHSNAQEPLSAYMRARTARIYPIFLLALAFSAAIFFIRQAYLPPPGQSSGTVSPRVLLGNVFMLQGPVWSHVRGCFAPWAGDDPLWTLSFEWWFYVCYWIVNHFVPARRQQILVYSGGAIGCLAMTWSPQFAFMWLALFAVWWAGVSLAREWRTKARLTLMDQIHSITALLAIWAMPILLRYTGVALNLPLDGMQAVQVTVERAVGTGLFVVLAAIVFQRPLLRLEIAPNKWKLNLGATSYSIYVLHFPLVLFICDFIHGGSLFRSAVCVPCVVLIAWVVEFEFQPRAAAFIKQRWAS